MALALTDWDSFPARRAEAKERGKLRGIGIANYVEITTGAPRERAEVETDSLAEGAGFELLVPLRISASPS
jgi:carbon-monoxide dehydrogenase large subunit